MLVPTSPGASNDSRMTRPSHTASTTFVPAPPSQRACQRPSQKSNCLRGSSMPVGRTNAGRGLPIPQFRDNAAVRVMDLPRPRPITFRVREPDGGVSMIEGTWSEARRIESWRPIYDRALDVHAYELLFRAGDAGRATAETVVTTFADIGLDALVGGRSGFVSVTRDFVMRGLVTTLPAERVALELHRSDVVDPQVLAELERLGGLGYTIVLDGFVVRD